MIKNKVFHRINDGIKSNQVRIVGDNIESRVCYLTEAIKLAESMDMDVVEINPNVNPPVCKIIRYDKFLYEEKRKQKEIDKKNRESRVDVKEIQFSPNIDTHDIEFKSKHAIKFLTEGDKVKLIVKFGGRQIMFKENGQKVLLEFVDKLSEYGVAEYLPKLEGKRMHITLKPKK